MAITTGDGGDSSLAVPSSHCDVRLPWTRSRTREAAGVKCGGARLLLKLKLRPPPRPKRTATRVAAPPPPAKVHLAQPPRERVDDRLRAAAEITAKQKHELAYACQYMDAAEQVYFMREVIGIPEDAEEADVDFDAVSPAVLRRAYNWAFAPAPGERGAKRAKLLKVSVDVDMLHHAAREGLDYFSWTLWPAATVGVAGGTGA